jgi:maltose O-acetyltransferase
MSFAYARLRRAHSERCYDLYRKRHAISPEFRFKGHDIAIYGEGELEAGPGSYIGARSSVALSPDTKVTIGRNCRIGRNTSIYTTSVDADAPAIASTTELPEKRGDVTIGDGVWIGVNCFIGPGVTIGSDAVVGANSVVTSAVEAGEIVGGVPAQTIRRKGSSR